LKRIAFLLATVGILLVALGFFFVFHSVPGHANRKDDALWDHPHTIRQYNGGTLIGEWTTVGRVTNEASGEYYFEDARTKQKVTVSGGIQLTMKGAELPLPVKEEETCVGTTGNISVTGNGSAAIAGNRNVVNH
jgi:hypothetical protein